MAAWPELYFVRHGETEWSAAGKHTSHTDIALTGRGEKQSRALAEALAGLKENVRLCTRCFNITTSDICAICASETRDQRTSTR